MRFTVQGTKAAHLITVYSGDFDDAAYEAIQSTIQGWSPESGNGFRTSGQAKGWLTTFLRKPGWPESTSWQIRKSGDFWHCYLEIV